MIDVRREVRHERLTGKARPASPVEIGRTRDLSTVVLVHAGNGGT